MPGTPAPPARTAPRRPTNRPTRRRGPGWKAYALAFFLTIGTGLGAGMLAGEYFAPVLPGSGDPTASDGGGEGFSLIPRLRDPLNVLVMATDVNYTYKNGRRVMGLTGNTDTMILARLDPPRDQIRLLSIPRDTRVAIPGHGNFKINAANPYGGPTLSAQTVADFLGVPVDRFVLLNTRAVVQLVDAIGGIDIFVPKRLYYNDYHGGLHINLQKGWNHLDGQQAHNFLRFRHDELGDIGRVQRQQAFIQAVLTKYMTPSNLLKTPELMKVAQENLQTNLANDELVKVVTWAKDLNRESVQMSMVPGVASNLDGVSYWIANEEGTRQVVQSFLTAEATAEVKSPQLYKVAVRDGVGAPSGMKAMRKSLLALGYGAVDLDGKAAQMEQDETQVIAQGGDVAGAQALVDSLGVGKVVVAATGNIYADFTVVLGKDWLEKQAAPTAAGTR